MRFVHARWPGRAVWLGYCLNLAPAEDLESFERCLARWAEPLATRLGQGQAFGVGLYLAAPLAARVAQDAALAARLAARLRRSRLLPFSFNAFPFGAFHRAGLKRAVFEPAWGDPRRLQFSLDVARAALALLPPEHGLEHLSISTHCGHFGPASRADRQRVARSLAHCAEQLARLERPGGPRLLLALEPEPRSAANDTSELALLWQELERCAGAEARLRLGACLDTCHAAVEFEVAGEALARATATGAALAKLQFSSALRLERPGQDALGRARLLELDEPVYLHQVSAVGPTGRLALEDLAQLAEQLQVAPQPWLDADEWRCHFHVPVDRSGRLRPDCGLSTTQSLADELARLVLQAPESWGLCELHLEIETYTWSVLPPELGRGINGEAPLEGLLAEYAHLQALLAALGWTRAAPEPAKGR